MYLTPLPIFTDVRPLQPKKALFSILVTELGMVIEDSSRQAKNAYLPMIVAPSSMTTDVNLLQLENALSAILVTELGIVTEGRL